MTTCCQDHHLKCDVLVSGPVFAIDSNPCGSTAQQCSASQAFTAQQFKALAAVSPASNLNFEWAFLQFLSSAPRNAGRQPACPTAQLHQLHTSWVAHLSVMFELEAPRVILEVSTKCRFCLSPSLVNEAVNDPVEWFALEVVGLAVSLLPTGNYALFTCSKQQGVLIMSPYRRVTKGLPKHVMCCLPCLDVFILATATSKALTPPRAHHREQLKAAYWSS